MKKFLAASIAGLVAFAASSAFGADLGVRRPPPPPPPIVPVPVFLWTGCYVGGNLGGAWSHKHFYFGTEDEGSNTAGGFAGGGQIGCDYQFGSSFVIGLQGMFDGTTIKSTDVDPTNDGDVFDTRVHWFGTVTGRLGYLLTPAVLLYGKGGVAWVNERHDFFLDGVASGASGNITRTGWDAGVGLEWMFAPNWSVWVEYDHMGFGSKDLLFADCCGGGFTEQIKQSVDKVLVGVNWRFSFGKEPVTPVVARY